MSRLAHVVSVGWNVKATDADDTGVNLNSGTGDLVERVRQYHINRQRRVFLGAETGNVQLINDNVSRLNIHRRNHRGYTPLHVAVDAGHLDAVEALLRARAKVDMRTGFDARTGHADPQQLRMPSIFIAAMRNHVDILEALLDAVADDAAKMNRRTSAGETAMMVAARLGHAECFDELRARGAALNLVDNRGNAAIHYAVSGGWLYIVNQLIVHHADLDLPGEGGFTPLQLAIRDEHDPVARRLLEAGADVDARNNGGATALHFACARGMRRIVRILLRIGADRTLLDADGVSARELAVEFGHGRIVQMLDA